mmetsp:Transcript_7142/g.9059  ORF Transcript_7142/g.9059 Transcript_7142/m.9059 type:complete len:80 (+) Transcript_7142:361-600(+)
MTSNDDTSYIVHTTISPRAYLNIFKVKVFCFKIGTVWISPLSLFNLFPLTKDANANRILPSTENKFRKSLPCEVMQFSP